jgi:hypothetical protein
MMTFDCAASAELFMPKRKSGARQPLSYRRFATAAEAIRFAVEEIPSIRFMSVKMGPFREFQLYMVWLQIWHLA